LLIVATAAVAGLTWGVMRQRIPEIDPGQVIAVNLSAARLALQDDRYIDPPEHSAAHYFRSVLTLDPNNEEAMRGLQSVADHFVTQAKDAILEAKFAEAALAIDHLRRLDPTNRRLELLDAELRKAIDLHISLVPSPKEQSTQSQPRVAKVAPATDDAARVTRAKQEARDLALAQAQLAIDAGDLTEARARVAEARSLRVPEQALVRLISAIEIVEESQSREAMSSSAVPRTKETYASIERAFKISDAYISAHLVSPDRRDESVKPAEQAPAAVDPMTSAPVLKALKLVQPNYPQAARDRGIEGWVDLTLTVAPSGDVIGAEIEEREGSRSFERAALLAVKQWKYQVSGAADSPQNVRVRVAFKLE
jgi:TonB family protein